MRRTDQGGAAYASVGGLGRRKCPLRRAWPQDHREASPRWVCRYRLSGWRWPRNVCFGHWFFILGRQRKSGLRETGSCKDRTYRVALENLVSMSLRVQVGSGISIFQVVLACVLLAPPMGRLRLGVVSVVVHAIGHAVRELKTTHTKFKTLHVGLKLLSTQSVVVLTSHMTTCRLKISERAVAFLCALTSGAIQNWAEIFQEVENQENGNRQDMLGVPKTKCMRSIARRRRHEFFSRVSSTNRVGVRVYVVVPVRNRITRLTQGAIPVRCGTTGILPL